MRTKPLKGPEKICRSHCFLGLPLKGFLLCLGILATRKRVYEFLDAYLVGYLVLLQLILDVSFNCFFVSPYCIYEIPSGPEMSVSIFRFACLSNIINVLFHFNHTKTADPPIKSRDSAILFFINCRKRVCVISSGISFLPGQFYFFLTVLRK